MPRQARLDAPGVLHHIMIHGIERRKIFINNRDREDMLERLAKLLSETQTACYACVFIPNHAHFLFRTGLTPLATVMRRLLTGYAVSFNRLIAATSAMASCFRIVTNPLSARKMPILEEACPVYSPEPGPCRHFSPHKRRMFVSTLGANSANLFLRKP